MDFLYCDPMVSLIGKDYEILVIAKENGIISLEIDGTLYYEENAGTLYTEKCHAKIRVPMAVLNEARKYTVKYRKTIDRKSYFSELGDAQTKEYSFRPVTKTDGLNLYHISDVHYRFELAKKTASFFGDDLDALLVNGDIGEVETVENYKEVAKFVGDITKGGLPVVFVRGNHDTRGHLAELYADYFPTDGEKTYFTFDLGPLHGIAFDCGEDKADTHAAYGGVNDFASFRRRETDFFKSLDKSGKLTFAIGHISPPYLGTAPDFQIEDETYRAWVNELERIGTAFMICGHLHRAYILEKNDPRSSRPHNFPIIIGAEARNGLIWGCALIIKDGNMQVLFTDDNHKIIEAHTVNLKTGNVD